MAAAREVVDELVQKAGAAEVTDEVTNLSTSLLLQEVKGHRKRLDDHRKAETQPHRDYIAHVNERAAVLDKDLEDAERKLKGDLIAWHELQARNLEQMVANTEAAAFRALEEGRTADADEHLTTLMELPAKVERVGGTSFSTRWRAEVTNIHDLIAAVANGIAPTNCLKVDQSYLDSFARRTKDESPIPGVRFVSEANMSASAR